MIYAIYVAVVVPVYWRHYGWQNFLWFSDIALFGTLIAVWTESSLLASMMALAVLVPELAWNVDFFYRLLTGKEGIGLAPYMFDPRNPLWIRALSLFHVVLPVLLIWLVNRLGYNSNAWLAQTIFACAVLIATYSSTDPAKNINWVFGPGTTPQTIVPPWLYLIGLIVFFSCVMYFPLHLLLKHLFGR